MIKTETHHLMKTKRPKRIDLNIRANEAGFRNFTSFAFVCYYGKKETLKSCASMISVSKSTMRNGLISNLWPVRGPSQAQIYVTRGAPRKKRTVDVWKRIRKNTPYIFPWCAFYTYYEKYLMTAEEIKNITKISTTLIYKLLRKYGIRVRTSGRLRERNDVAYDYEGKRIGSS